MAQKIFAASYAELVNKLGLDHGQQVVLGPALIYGSGGDDDRWCTHVFHPSGRHDAIVLGTVAAADPPDALLSVVDCAMRISLASDRTREEAKRERRAVIRAMRAAGVKVHAAETEVEAIERWIGIGGGENAVRLLAPTKAHTASQRALS